MKTNYDKHFNSLIIGNLYISYHLTYKSLNAYYIVEGFIQNLIILHVLINIIIPIQLIISITQLRLISPKQLTCQIIQ